MTGESDDDHPDDVTVTCRVENAPLELPGSERQECEQCGETVVVNPATLESIEQGIYPEYILCMQCIGEGDG